ncbi:MAG: cobalt ECF transporter T component CbiQ [Phycisphaerae bacterium]|nr:cobalt ECF transporter T component CbiQ [Phycisphaerae bacterium]
MHDFAQNRPPLPDSRRELDVRVKLILALAAIAAVVLSSKPTLPLAVLAACLFAGIALGLPIRKLLARFAGPFAVALFVGLLLLFTTRGTPLFTVRPLRWAWTATREGAAAGELVAARVLGSVAVIVLLCSFTAAWQMFAAMRWARCPRTLVEIAALMYRHIFSLLESAGSVMAAQKVRLGYATVRGAMRSAGSMAGIVVLRAIDQAARSHDAMLARGYRDSLQIAPLPRLGWRNWLLTVGWLTLLAGAFLAAERWTK